MQLLMEKPACAGRANPAVLANIFNKPDFIVSLPPIQANRKAERKFALELGQRVFGHPIAIASNDNRKNAIPRTAEVESPLKALTARMNLSPELARWILKSESIPAPIAVDGKRYAHRDSGLKLKRGPLSARLGGEYVYGSPLPEQQKRREAWHKASGDIYAQKASARSLDPEDLLIGSLHSCGSAPDIKRLLPQKSESPKRCERPGSQIRPPKNQEHS